MFPNLAENGILLLTTRTFPFTAKTINTELMCCPLLRWFIRAVKALTNFKFRRPRPNAVSPEVRSLNVIAREIKKDLRRNMSAQE